MISPPRSPSLDDLLSAYERVVIMETLRRNDWNRRKAAAALKISPRRLHYRLAALHFELRDIPHDRPGRRFKGAVPFVSGVGT